MLAHQSLFVGALNATSKFINLSRGLRVALVMSIFWAFLQIFFLLSLQVSGEIEMCILFSEPCHPDLASFCKILSWARRCHGMPEFRDKAVAIYRRVDGEALSCQLQYSIFTCTSNSQVLRDLAHLNASPVVADNDRSPC